MAAQQKQQQQQQQQQQPARALRKAAAAHAFDKAAAQPPYMFVGALAPLDPARRLTRMALRHAVEDADAVTPAEALAGWALPLAEHAALGERPTVEAVSAAAYAHHQYSARAFRAAVSDETWELWLSLARVAETDGVDAALLAARVAGVQRDSRRVVLHGALYFAGLAADAPGENATACLLRDHRLRHALSLEYLADGPADDGAMRAEADAVAAAIAAEAAAPKRKRGADGTPTRQARRAALMSAILDAGGDAPAGAGAGALTDEERTFVDDGPRRLADMMAEAHAIARKRRRTGAAA